MSGQEEPDSREMGTRRAAELSDASGPHRDDLYKTCSVIVLMTGFSGFPVRTYSSKGLSMLLFLKHVHLSSASSWFNTWECYFRHREDL